MGKALLIIVLGAGLVLTQQLYTAFLNEDATGEDQVAYQQDTIAREIAASAFNLGMGVVRAHGENVQAGAIDLNGALNKGRSGTYTSGRFAGGRYEVHAELTSPHSVRVIAKGYFGRKTDPNTQKEDWAGMSTMHDEYRVFVLTSRSDGLIDVSFLESQAGYCSAVFYQAFTPSMTEGTVPEMQLLFAPDNRDRRTARPSQTIYVEAGTQMNFSIGVDQNCSLRLPSTLSECGVRTAVRDYVYKVTDFDYVHSALAVKAGSLDQAREDIWGIVEQKPGDRQRWRIAWEDIHNVSWDNRAVKDPAKSLQALKVLGYDGTGWPEQDANLYRLLRDYGSRPDFSDQVIEVNVVSARSQRFVEIQDETRATQKACGEPEQEPVAREDPQSPPSSSPTPSSPSPTDSDPLTTFACQCTQNNTNTKTPLLHRPPGNESNEQLLCLPDPAVKTHRRQHNDVFPTCNARQDIQNKNK